MSENPKVPKRAPVVKIPVSKEAIETACRKNSSHCMIADAIKTAIPKAAFVSVDLQTIRWTDKDKGLRYTYLTPRAAQDALVRFDRGIQPPPFLLTLRGAQTSSVTRSKKMPNGKRQTVRRHKFGKRKLLAVPHGQHVIPESIGGNRPPMAALANNNKGARLPHGN